MRSIILTSLLAVAGCPSETTCIAECSEGLTVALEAELWRDGVYEINAKYKTDGVEHEAWCIFTLPDAADAGCSIDSADAPLPTLEVGETVYLTIPDTPTRIDLTLYDAHAYIESYMLSPQYVLSGCGGGCRVAMVNASFAAADGGGAEQ